MLELIDKLEQDEDVQKVYHTLAVGVRRAIRRAPIHRGPEATQAP